MQLSHVIFYFMIFLRDGTNEALSRIRIIESLSVKVAYKYKSVKAKIRLIRAADENFVNGGVKRKFQDFRDGLMGECRLTKLEIDFLGKQR